VIGLLVKDCNIFVASLSEMKGSTEAKDASSDDDDGRVFGGWQV
jgi:hypothetical protein